MSLILDALSRSERERRAREQGVPDLLVAPTPTGSQDASARTWMFVAPMLVLFGAGSWWLWPATDSGVNPGIMQPVGAVSSKDPIPRSLPPAPPPAPARPARESASVAAEDPVANTRSPGRVADPEADAVVRALYARPETAAAPAAAPDPRTPAAAASPATPRETPATPSEAAEDVKGESAVDIEQVLEAARRTLADSALAPHATPLLGDLSRQFRDRVPTLMYLRHDFADGGSAAVVINGESLRAGQRVDGVMVQEILPDSVILRFDGQEFRLRALNSWINL